jgi:hypothetical protein
VLKLSQLKFYENIVIGNFLYGLGFAISTESAKSSEEATFFPSIISLLQQQPMDKPLGDVLLEFSEGIVRLIEFKNKKGDHKKERTKYENLAEDIQRKIIDEALNEMGERYTNISRAIHWFIETDPKGDNFVSRIVPYLDAYPEDNTQDEFKENAFEKFIKQTADDAVNKKQSFSEKDLSDYLWYIARLQIGHKNGSKKDIPEAAGILLLIHPSGNLKVAGLPSMMHLKLQDREYINTMRIYQKLEQTQKNEPNVSKIEPDIQEIETDTQKIESNVRKIGGIHL